MLLRALDILDLLTIPPELLNNTTPAIDYLKTYTWPFITAAEEGSKPLFEDFLSPDLETREASAYTYTLFAWMHEMVTSKALPQGFSRKRILKAPLTREEFLERTREIKYQIANFAAGNVETAWKAGSPSLLRTYCFFLTAKRLPIKFTPEEKKA